MIMIWNDGYIAEKQGENILGVQQATEVQYCLHSITKHEELLNFWITTYLYR